MKAESAKGAESAKDKINSKWNHSDENGLGELEEEIFQAKDAVLELLQSCPENLQAHRVYCTYISKILDLYKTRAQTRVLEPERIMVDTLKCVVLTLIEKSEIEAAEVVGRFLEEIEEKVRERWEVTTEAVSKSTTVKSDPSSNQPVLLSESVPPRKKRSVKKKA